MFEEFEEILKVGEKRISRLAYTVWDIYTYPQIVHYNQINSSFRFSYDLHSTLFGSSNEKIIENYDPKGEISLSFDLEWLDLVQNYFTNFKVMDKSASGKEMNTFLCMELQSDDFKPLENYQAQIMDDSLITKLSFKQRMLFSEFGGGGVGIVKERQLIGVAFAPHIIQNNRFSFAIIRGVRVAQEHRNKGYGYDVSAKMCDVLFSRGVEFITLWVEESNLPAVKIYQKMGFKTKDKVYGTDCVKQK